LWMSSGLTLSFWGSLLPSFFPLWQTRWVHLWGLAFCVCGLSCCRCYHSWPKNDRHRFHWRLEMETVIAIRWPRATACRSLFTSHSPRWRIFFLVLFPFPRSFVWGSGTSILRLLASISGVFYYTTGVGRFA
jgi:hypothetical protein